MKIKLLSFTLSLVFFQLIQAQSEKDFVQINNRDIQQTQLFQKNNTLLNQSRTLIPLYDSIYNWTWDTATTGWKLVDKHINIIYNTNHKMISFMVQSWNGTGWINTEKGVFSFDAGNNQTNSIYQVWNGTTWTYSHKTVNTFDVNNNNLTVLNQTWNGTAWIALDYKTNTFDANNNKITAISQTWNGTAFVNVGKFTYIYDANNDVTSDSYQTWSGTSWVYTNGIQDLYTYDANHNQLSRILQIWSGTTWVNSYKITSDFDANNNVITLSTFSWNGTVWVDGKKTTSTYDANNKRTSHLTQSWNGTAWVDYSKDIDTYDANNNKIIDLNQIWNGTIWRNAFENRYSFNADNIEKSYSFKNWGSSGLDVTSGDSTFYYFQQSVSGIHNLDANYKSLIIAPNPFSSQTTIFFAEEQKNCTIKIINILGKEVKTINFSGKEFLIEKDGMIAGIYFVQIFDGTKKIVNRKIIVQ